MLSIPARLQFLRKLLGTPETQGMCCRLGTPGVGDRQVRVQVPVGLAGLLHRGMCSSGARQGLSTGREGNKQCDREPWGPCSAVSAELQLPPMHMLLIFHTEHSCRQHLFPTPVPASFYEKRIKRGNR